MRDMQNKGEVVIFIDPNGTIQTEVRMQSETLWLTEQQIATVFERDRTVIGRHIKAIFSTGELDEKSNVQKMHSAKSDKPVSFYSLDMILSVGYRVNSKCGTQFRIWANRILKDHLLQGYTLNQKRLQEKQTQLDSLKKSISLVERSLFQQVENIDQARQTVMILSDFAKGLAILDDYDHETLETKGKTTRQVVLIEPEEKDTMVKIVMTILNRSTETI